MRENIHMCIIYIYKHIFQYENIADIEPKFKNLVVYVYIEKIVLIFVACKYATTFVWQILKKKRSQKRILFHCLFSLYILYLRLFIRKTHHFAVGLWKDKYQYWYLVLISIIFLNNRIAIQPNWSILLSTHLFKCIANVQFLKERLTSLRIYFLQEHTIKLNLHISTIL